MSDRGTADQDLFQIWLASSRTFFATESMTAPMPDALKEQCEGLFAAWSRFARVYAEASGSTQGKAKGDATGGPFDPVGWLDAAGGGGLGDLWRWFGAAQGADPWREERDTLTHRELAPRVEQLPADIHSIPAGLSARSGARIAAGRLHACGQGGIRLLGAFAGAMHVVVDPVAQQGGNPYRMCH